MAEHSFTVVPASYIILLREATTARPAQDATGTTASSAEVLLQLRRNTGYMDNHWACGAAGHVEAGESAFAAALRETREELGLRVREAALEPLTAMHRTNGTDAPIEQRLDMFFLLRDWQGTPTIQEASKNAGLRWFALDALPELVPPHERMVLELLRTQLDGGAPVPPIVSFGF